MTLSTQFYTMLSMILMGSLLGMSLDTYQRFLNRPNQNRWIVFVHDLLFWILQALVIFYVLYLVNYGEVRFYLFLAILLGFSMYQALLKRFYLMLQESVIDGVVSVYRFIVKLLTILVYRPIRGLLLFLLATILWIGRAIWKIVGMLFLLLWKFVRIFLLLPLKWIFLQAWKLFPKTLTTRVDNLYEGTGKFILKKKKALVHYISNRKKK
ncbi:spore coat protein [Bacillus coahuilensis p1.1.43]|uniref:Spore coat protein n=1 Tax=Bacillus coahuilensis p1.1.43 TaxID=1150625 RepID=A0A147K4X1_9BACI|nr:spore cortex biosynthesis protein YabQ [Bacillus coahuilensis]KUP04553.1 spore coat protein [Bacillus coahuilensis p1.1.43]